MNNAASSSSKVDKKRWPRLSIRSKLLVSFLLLSVVSFAIVGYLAVLNMNKIGRFAEESSATLGDSAASDSATALEKLGEVTIRQKAIDVSNQVRIYLTGHLDMGAEEISNDHELAKIAVQSVGETGYTCLYEKETAITRLHPNPDLIDFDMHNWKEELPSYWKVFEPSLDGSISSGYYDWLDADGNIRQKFMYMAPVEGTTYMVAATTYIDEFSQPAAVTKSKIAALTSQTTEHINMQIESTQHVFIIFFIVVLLATSGLVFLLSRMISKPIIALAKGSEAIGGGNLDHKVEVKSGDELEGLANSFNKMASDLKGYMEELRRSTAEKERIEKELEIARGIQQSFLPEFPPQVEGVELSALSVPAWEVGGDFYDFIPIGGDRWGLVVADVSGKGVPAALFMALSRILVRANAVGDITVSEAIRRTNDLIVESDRSSMFVTLFYGVLDPKRRTLTYVSAGHNPALMVPGYGGDTIMLRAKGIALGVIPDIELEEKEISLEKGDIIVLYTDGVTEAINDKEEQFGQHRLTTIAEQTHNLPASEIAKRIQQEVIEFSQGQPQFDDITVVILKIL